MRIVIAHNYYQQAGGEDQVFAAEAKLLRSRGHQVILYSVHNDAVTGRNPLGVATGAIWSRRSYRELLRLFQSVRPDVVHVHNSFPLISPAIYYAAEDAGAATVQTLHNFRLSCPGAFFYRNGAVCEECLGRRFAWPGIIHSCYRGSRAATLASAASTALHRVAGTYQRKIHRYIANTEFGAAKFAQMGIPSRKIAVKPNFLADDPGRGSGRGGYALFVGRLSPEKGIDIMLEAARMQPGLPLKIAGTGPEEGKAEAASRIHPSITFLGKQSREEVFQLMKEAAFLVFPSLWYEGFPMTIVEAHACGLPIIASNLGCMSSIIEHRKNGLHFATGDAEDLARQMRWASDNAADTARMRIEARRRFEDHFTPEPNYRMMIRIYQEAIEERDGVVAIAHRTQRPEAA